MEQIGIQKKERCDEKTQEKHKVIKKHSKEKHTVGLEPTISCSVGKRLIQLGYACLLEWSNDCYLKNIKSREIKTRSREFLNNK